MLKQIRLPKSDAYTHYDRWGCDATLCCYPGSLGFPRFPSLGFQDPRTEAAGGGRTARRPDLWLLLSVWSACDCDVRRAQCASVTLVCVQGLAIANNERVSPVQVLSSVLTVSIYNLVVIFLLQRLVIFLFFNVNFECIRSFGERGHNKTCVWVISFVLCQQYML